VTAASSDEHGGLPPGQRRARGWPVLHYGRVPRFREEGWDLQVAGATESGGTLALTWQALQQLPSTEMQADLHCVTGFSVPMRRWYGIPASEIVRREPPAPSVTHVLVWAEFGYSTNLRLADFASSDALLATHEAGAPLPPDRGGPLRLVVPHLYAYKGPKWVRAFEYLTEDRRGFWEERGYHTRGVVEDEERYSHRERG
jgi:DMSO/TMAO reductase YedYZ molybdopterin-dependent catalytic subunit